jgi:hypothetical protein
LIDNAIPTSTLQTRLSSVNEGNPIQFNSSGSRTFTDRVGEILGDNDGEKIPIFLGETQFHNNVIVAGTSDQALIVQKTEARKFIASFLNKVMLARITYTGLLREKSSA